MEYNQNIPPEELEEIERYLRDEMDRDEAEAFVRKLRADDSLAQKVDEVKLTILGINEVVLTDRMAGYHKGFRSATTTPIPPTKTFSWKWLLAASLLFIVAFSGWWIIQQNSSTQSIYSKYYRPDPGLMTLMSTGTSNYSFEKAMVEYKNGDYEKALTTWTQLLKEEPHNDTLLYFTGVASQALNDYDATISYLKSVAENGQSGFQSDACWYLGLAYLQKGEKAKAANYLKRSEHPQSGQLLEEMSK